MKLYYNKIIMLFTLLNVSSYTFALQELSEAILSESTAQDGITLSFITTQDLTATLAWTDTDGMESGLHGLSSGHISAPASVVLGDGTPTDTFKISQGTTTAVIDTDGSANGAFVNVAIDLPQNLTINTGSISVAKKDASDIAQSNAGNFQNKIKIMDDMQIVLKNASININLGSQPQGNFLALSGTSTDGLQINNINIIDNSVNTAKAGIGMDSLTIKDDLGDHLTLDSTVQILPTGINVNLAAGKKVDLLVDNLKFGNLALNQGIGDMAVIGLDLGGKSIRISGH